MLWWCASLLAFLVLVALAAGYGDCCGGGRCLLAGGLGGAAALRGQRRHRKRATTSVLGLLPRLVGVDAGRVEPPVAADLEPAELRGVLPNPVHVPLPTGSQVLRRQASAHWLSSIDASRSWWLRMRHASARARTSTRLPWSRTSAVTRSAKVWWRAA